MKHKKFLITSFILLLAFVVSSVFFRSPAVYASAEDNDVQTVKVGFFAFSGYHIMSEDGEGKRSGYGYEFLRLLSRYLDWEFDYVGYDKSYDENVKMLENGEIDILTSVSWNEDRAEKFLFSDKAIGTNSTIFTVKSGNSNVVKGDYSTYDGLKIGVLVGNSKNKIFEDFSKENNFTYEPIEYATEPELSAALENNEVDGIVSGSLRSMGNEWLMESLDPNPFYICTRKDEHGQVLMDAINSALDELDFQDPIGATYCTTSIIPRRQTGR